MTSTPMARPRFAPPRYMRSVSACLRNEVLEITGRVPRPLIEYEKRFLMQDLHDGQFGMIHARRRRIKAFESAWARLQSEQPGWPNDPVDQRFHQQLLDWRRFTTPC